MKPPIFFSNNDLSSSNKLQKYIFLVLMGSKIGEILKLLDIKEYQLLYIRRYLKKKFKVNDEIDIIREAIYQNQISRGDFVNINVKKYTLGIAASIDYNEFYMNYDENAQRNILTNHIFSYYKHYCREYRRDENLFTKHMLFTKKEEKIIKKALFFDANKNAGIKRSKKYENFISRNDTSTMWKSHINNITPKAFGVISLPLKIQQTIDGIYKDLIFMLDFKDASQDLKQKIFSLIFYNKLINLYCEAIFYDFTSKENIRTSDLEAEP